MHVRPLLEQLEHDRDPTPGLAYLAAQGLDLDADELKAARRRALLLLAAGGDPRRELEPESRAVASVAADLDAPDRRAALASELALLRSRAESLDAVVTALDRLIADGELAWRWLACVLLAEELAGDDLAG